jgi:hypothetical protein
MYYFPHVCTRGLPSHFSSPPLLRAAPESRHLRRNCAVELLSHRQISVEAPACNPSQIKGSPSLPWKRIDIWSREYMQLFHLGWMILCFSAHVVFFLFNNEDLELQQRGWDNAVITFAIIML